ncbi:hypothetical protein [Acrocarpospora pleiomorpha]|uniref:hypothetical protein n=1 Tax=Acrocarpospora pleiomorpha TaxID=90975 RepID=UPI0012D33CD3|nr:hypothetical protein [Acrocarpospora pleiomorpha]
MARIETRIRKDGKTKTYRVSWRLGGSRTGAWQSETFERKAPAVTFKLAVEACDHQWPDNWIRGSGWAPANEPTPPAKQDPLLFAEYAQRFVAALSGIEERTRHDYQRDLKNHILPAFGVLDLRDETENFDRAIVSAWVNTLHLGIPNPDHPRQWLRRPLAPKTIQNLHGLLYAILRNAVETVPLIRTSNPAARTRLPRLDDGEGDEEMVFLTEQEFLLLRAGAKPDVRDMLGVAFTQVSGVKLGTRGQYASRASIGSALLGS